MNYNEFIKILDGHCVVDFWAEWCEPCKNFSSVFEEISKKYKEVNFIKINFDENQGLCQELGIMSLPTLQFYFYKSFMDEKIGISNKNEFIDFIEKNIK